MMEQTSAITIKEPPSGNVYLIIIGSVLVLIMIFTIVWALFFAKREDRPGGRCPCPEIPPGQRCRAIWNTKDQSLTFDQAQEYCRSHGAKMATKDEVISAGSRGFDNCIPGWYNDATSFDAFNPGIGYYVGDESCGDNSVRNSWVGLEDVQGAKASVYCIGPLPSGSGAPEVNRFIYL